MTYAHEYTIAIEAVQRACVLCRRVQRSLSAGHTITKADASPVTVADFGAQALIVSHLRQHFHDMMVGEEEAALLRQPSQRPLTEHVTRLVQDIDASLDERAILDAIDAAAAPCDGVSRFWTLDPIDGTKGFVRGAQYAIALALIEEGRPVLGVLGCPNLPCDPRFPDRQIGNLFTAVCGQGAFLHPLDGSAPQPIRVDAIADPRQARYSESVEAGHASQKDHAALAAHLGMDTPPLRTDGQCKYAVVARGEASLYLRLTTDRTYRSWVWDHAAGVILSEEAGGRVTDMHGKALDFSQGRKLLNNSGVIATNGLLHDGVLEAIQQIF